MSIDVDSITYPIRHEWIINAQLRIHAKRANRQPFGGVESTTSLTNILIIWEEMRVTLENIKILVKLATLLYSSKWLSINFLCMNLQLCISDLLTPYCICDGIYIYAHGFALFLEFCHCYFVYFSLSFQQLKLIIFFNIFGVELDFVGTFSQLFHFVLWLLQKIDDILQTVASSFFPPSSQQDIHFSCLEF